MKSLKYFYIVLANLVFLLAFLLVLAQADTSFERLLLAMLALLFTTIWGVKAQMSDGFTATHQRQNAIFLRIAELLKDEHLPELQAATKDLDELVREVKFAVLLNGIFVWLMGVIAMIVIVGVLLG